MEECARFLIDYAERHGPVTVRQALLPRRGRGAARHRQNRQRLRQDPATSLEFAARRPAAIRPYRRLDPLDAQAAHLRQCRGGIAGNRPALPQGAVARRRGHCRGLVREGCAQLQSRISTNLTDVTSPYFLVPLAGAWLDCCKLARRADPPGATVPFPVLEAPRRDMCPGGLATADAP